MGFTLCINNREGSYKVERLCLFEDIGHVCLESNPSQVGVSVSMAHERGHTEGMPIIFISMSTPTCTWFGLMLTFIFHYIGHCMLFVLTLDWC